MLQLIDVKKSYHNNKAVDGISFEVKKGEIFGLIGANGAGKSTTISMIATLIKPDEGDILYQDISLVKNPKIIQSDLGYIPQDIGLYPSLTGLDNLVFWGKAYGISGGLLYKRIDEVCNIIGFTKDIVKKKVKTYSGGMKRRLNIGVALLHQPKIVIMDEPTVGIDIITRNQILDAVMVLKDKGTTVIYCGHYMEEVERICDTICILDKGNIITYGSKEKLLTTTNGIIPLEKLYLELLLEK